MGSTQAHHSFGLHPLDLAVVGIYFVLLVVIGLAARRHIKSEKDFFLGGQKLGKLLLIFMNFGMATGPDTAVTAARETFRQGMAGVWIQLHVLFVTPFYWFTHVWLRRLRVMSMAEIFVLRYESRAIEKTYVLLGMLALMALIAMGMVALEKTTGVMLPKPEWRLSEEERASLRDFQTLSFLEEESKKRELSPEEEGEYERLRALRARRQIRPVIPAVDPRILLGSVAVVVLVYSAVGGLLAAAVTDLVQGALLLLLSFLLFGAGLMEIGGFSALHQSVSPSAFQLFGTAAGQEYTWYYVLAVTLVVLNQVVISPEQAQVIGSARDEETARLGGITGVFLKRFSVVLWGFTGVLGYALYRDFVTDPDMLWGHMSRELLGPGLVGLMIVCLLAAVMSSADAFVIAAGALFTRNVYEPLFPERSQREYLWAGRMAGMVLLLGATLIALRMQDLLLLVRFFWSIGLVFGPIYWIAILWRRATTAGAAAAIIYSGFFTVFLANVAADIPALARLEYLTQTTRPRLEVAEVTATWQDVGAGRAQTVGERIRVETRVPPVAVFFEEVVREPSDHPDSPLVGVERLRTALLWPALLGVDLTGWSKSGLISLAYYLDVFIPFTLLILVSLLSRPNSERALRVFYGRLHTPAWGDPAGEAKALERAVADPNYGGHRKLFHSHLELEKPTVRDLVGFLLAWAVAGVVILFLVLLTRIGAVS